MTRNYRRIYVWELPVRAFHWINALCLLTLGVTGFLIGQPFSVSYHLEASSQYIFGTIRFLHFAAGYLFLINMLVRTWWGFVGNRYASWKEFIPTSGKAFTEIGEVLKVDVLQTKAEGRISIGHNRLAGFIYFLTMFVFAFQAITGFALYAAMSRSWAGKAAAWIVAGFGNDMAVRQWHHAMMWFYVVFGIVHIYLVFYHDYVEGRGTTSSMVGGWKFEREDRINH